MHVHDIVPAKRQLDEEQNLIMLQDIKHFKEDSLHQRG